MAHTRPGSRKESSESRASGSPQKQTVAPGTVVFHQGESTTDVFLIHSGAISISISEPEGDYVLNQLKPGMLFGEMGLLSDPPRTVTATAMEETVISSIPLEAFAQRSLGLPKWSLSIAKSLADRLKSTASAFERLIRERSHTATFGPANIAINLSPTSLEISYYPDIDIHRLSLEGLLTTANVETLLNRINELRRQKISPVILNFAGIIEIQKEVMDKLVGVAKNSTEVTGLVQFENVQFVAHRLRDHEGYQVLLSQDRTPVRRVGFGEHLIRQGDKGTEMFVVKTGSFVVYRQFRGADIILCRAHEGDVIGEIALITGKVRSASVRAEKSSQVYVISLKDFQENSHHLPPWFLHLIKGLAHRVRSINESLESYLSGDLKPVPLVPGRLTIAENIQVPG